MSAAIGCIVLYLSSALASSAGVGGGTLNVPILVSIFGFDYSTAVVLSLCTLMGNYSLQVLVNLDKRHPSSETKPLIYWDAVLMLLPAELGGSNLGVILSSGAPDTVLYIVAMIVLVIAGGLTFNKALHLYEAETQELLQDEAEEQPLLTSDTSSSTAQEAQHLSEGDAEAPSQNTKDSNKKKVTIMSLIPSYMRCCCNSASNADDHDSKTYCAGVDPDEPPIHVPWLVVSVIFSFLGVYLACYLVQRSFPLCSNGYYIVLGVIYVVLIVVLAWGFNYVWKVQRKHPETIAEGDFHWGWTSIGFPMFTFLVGILSALLGIGGGELIGPMMLMSKVLPAVSSGTTSMMSALNTISSVAHYLVMGRVPYGYGAGMFVIGALGGFSGRLLALYFVALFRRGSILVFTLITVLLLSFLIYVDYILTESADVTFTAIC